jgi:hypothetical protein
MFSSSPGYIALVLLSAHTVWTNITRAPNRWWHGRPFFALLLAATFIVAHGPLLGYGMGLPNPDEAQLLAGAITLRQHFAPWMNVDLSTAGPLSVLPLLLVPPGFQCARWLAALCIAAAMVLSWLAADRSPGSMSRIAALPVAAFFVCMQDIELFQFSTEHVAIVLLAAASCIWLAASAGCERAPRGGALFGCGVCLGAAVMAKLQSAPCVAWLAGYGAILLLTTPALTPAQRAGRVAALATGCAAAPGFFLLLALGQGVLPDLVHSYGLNNFNYVRDMNAGSPGYQPALVWGLNYLLKPAIAVTLLCLLAIRHFSPAQLRTAGLAVGLGLTAVIAIVLPGRGSRHYWLFVPGPVCLLMGALLPSAWQHLGTLVSSTRLRGSMVALVFALLALPAFHRFGSGRNAAIEAQLPGTFSVRNAGRHLRSLAQTGDSLTVWGWCAELHVYSGLPQGTREAHTQWLIDPVPQREYYRQRFLADLARNRPRFIADAVGPHRFNYTDRSTAGHETFPPFAALMAEHYQFIGELDGVRLYVRHDS